MNDKLVQLVDRLWSYPPKAASTSEISWLYKGYNIELYKSVDANNKEHFYVYIIKEHRYLITSELEISEIKNLNWRLNYIETFDKFSNNLLNTLLEEDDASCFDDLLETNKNE